MPATFGTVTLVANTPVAHSTAISATTAMTPASTQGHTERRRGGSGGAGAGMTRVASSSPRSACTSSWPFA